jgi:hypothetical protein
MDQNIILTIVEFGASLIIEGIILSMIFNWISNKSTEKTQENLQREITNIEKQNKFDFVQLQNEIRDAKNDIISEIKERT